MNSLSKLVHVKTAYTRSINLARDGDTLELVNAYLPTSRAIHALTQVADGLHDRSGSRALALIGPYGSGKSAFALFLGALLSPEPSQMHQAATAILQSANPALAKRYTQALQGRRGLLRVQVNGLPDSLVRQLLQALATAVEKSRLPTATALSEQIRAAAVPGLSMDRVVAIFQRVQNAWADQGGSGVLIEIDELGKFLEYASFHPQHREIHLLQLLAEQAQTAHRAPLHLVVMLHQAFEQYGHHLGKSLRDEWQKVQGRFTTLAFLEPAEQSLRIVAAAFQRKGGLTPEIQQTLAEWAKRLAAEEALPLGIGQTQALALFERCYPLHPLTLLTLPVLCQKVAQNERTLFSYLGSGEPFGLREQLGKMALGDWVGPWQLYDYFMLNPAGGFADPLTYHRWIEVATALERFDSAPNSPAVQLLKTVGLFNLMGSQRGLKASQALLKPLYGAATATLLAELVSASVIHFRQFSQEYRVWQGSDFDLAGALRQAAAEYAESPLDKLLNTLAPLKPIVARRVTIESGSLRSYAPLFAAHGQWPEKPRDGKLPLWFYLAEPQEPINPTNFPEESVVAVCDATERLREAVTEWVALLDLPKRHAVLHQDPVAHREHSVWLANAEAEALQLIRGLLGEPESGSLIWYWGGTEILVNNRRHLQELLSDWVENTIYKHAPKFRNELINRDQPSASANSGRKRLLAAMLAAPDQENLGIDQTPAEKSLYLSLLKESGLHRQQDGRRGFYPPPEHDPCRVRRVWAAITSEIGDGGQRQIPLPDLYSALMVPPFGVKQGVLPILVITYLLAHRREVALYQEGAFCETLTIEQAELLCRRPALFALERFDLGGLRGELFDRYIGSVVGQVRQDATLLDIVRPLVRFMGSLPEYTQHCAVLSPEAKRVRDVFQQAKSPGTLLFEALPQACGVFPGDFATGDSTVVEHFVQRLVGVLREFKRAYPLLLEHWQTLLNRALLDVEITDLAELRKALAARYQGLERYTTDRMGLGALARRLADTAHENDQAWLESVATLIGRMPPAKWREDIRLQAEVRLNEMVQQLRDLETLRAAVSGKQADSALLLKVVDVERGERSRVVQLSAAQRAKADQRVGSIARQFDGLDEAERLAVVAELFKLFAPS